MYSQALLEYCKGFNSSPLESLSPSPARDRKESVERWWESLLSKQLEGVHILDSLSHGLPQLLLPQRAGVSHSSHYKRLVLQGHHFVSLSLASTPSAWVQPDKLQCQVVDHLCGFVPVLSTPCREDFALMVRAFAHRAEPAPVAAAVHGIAIEGLIHWHLSEDGIPTPAKIRLIILHDAPYGSLPAYEVPGNPSHQDWVAASGVWRLEHELTHLATRCFWGKMRLNLLDELIADGMGMVKALGMFDATLFLRCLGIEDCCEGLKGLNARWTTYVKSLNDKDQAQVLQWICQRALELEQAFRVHPGILDDAQTLKRFEWLCTQRLDTPISLLK